MLYIIATPIGNLKDITLRALEVLKEVDFVACEDTRVTAKLLNHYNIKKPLISYHQHSKITRVEKIIEHLEAGKNIALVTDAGTPGISDPGNKLVELITQNVKREDIRVIPIPGPSALGAMISVAGINLQKFVYLGFPPHKKGRETFFRNIFNFDYPVIIFESKHRIKKTIADIADFSGLGGDGLSGKGIKIIVGRELTKLFEEIIRGDVEYVSDYFEKNEDKIKGEFVIIIYKEK